MTEEIVKALKMESKVSVAVPPGGMQIVGNGVNSGGPFIFEGKNANASLMTGVLQ
jgi:hypothetical protein